MSLSAPYGGITKAKLYGGAIDCRSVAAVANACYSQVNDALDEFEEFRLAHVVVDALLVDGTRAVDLFLLDKDEARQGRKADLGIFVRT